MSSLRRHVQQLSWLGLVACGTFVVVHGHSIECNTFPNTYGVTEYQGGFEEAWMCPNDNFLKGVICERQRGCLSSAEDCGSMNVQCYNSKSLSKKIFAEFELKVEKDMCVDLNFDNGPRKGLPFNISCPHGSIAVGISCDSGRCDGKGTLSCCRAGMGAQVQGERVEFDRFNLKLQHTNAAVVRSLGTEGLCPPGEVVLGFLHDGRGKTAVSCSRITFECASSTCSCKSGWKGDACEHCTNDNSCNGNGLCELNSGHCVCNDGFDVSNACQECMPGYFGKDCHQCDCDAENCDWGISGTGKCTCEGESCSKKSSSAFSDSESSVPTTKILIVFGAVALGLFILYLISLCCGRFICYENPGVLTPRSEDIGFDWETHTTSEDSKMKNNKSVSAEHLQAC